jgi:hypothetical protein
MAFSPNLDDRERDKFVESPSRSGMTAVEVFGTLTSSSGPFAPPAGANAVVRSVAGAVETFQYKSGGISGTLLKTVTVTYTDSTLDELLTVEIS